MTNKNLGRPAELLLVEDDSTDVLLTKKALQKGGFLNNLSVVKDGEEAMDFLHQRGDYTNAPVPDIILLDLNMPRKDGREVLQEVKTDESLQHIPIIVLTTSDAEQDVLKSYKLHANCYIKKPVDLHQFVDAIASLQSFWLSVVKLPRGETWVRSI